MKSLYDCILEGSDNPQFANAIIEVLREEYIRQINDFMHNIKLHNDWIDYVKDKYKHECSLSDIKMMEKLLQNMCNKVITEIQEKTPKCVNTFAGKNPERPWKMGNYNSTSWEVLLNPDNEDPEIIEWNTELCDLLNIRPDSPWRSTFGCDQPINHLFDIHFQNFSKKVSVDFEYGTLTIIPAIYWASFSNEISFKPARKKK